jgi:tetratricopeptide (TPR) repeat protein
MLDHGRGQKERAYQELESVIKRQPKSEQAQLLKARFLTTDRRFAEVVPITTEVLKANPKSDFGQYLHASALDATGQREAGLAMLKELLGRNPTLVAAQLKLIEMYLATGDLDGARDLAQQAVKSRPESIVVRTLAARVALARGDLRAAETDLVLIAKVTPDSPQVQTLLGDLYRRQGKLSVSERAYARALELDPSSLPALTGVLQSDLDAHRLDEARTKVTTRLEQEPKNPSLLILTGRVLAATGDMPRAESMFREAVTVDPNRMDGYVALAGLYKAQRKLDDARHEFDEVAQRNPAAAFAAKTLAGVMLESQGKQDEARKYYEEALTLNSRAGIAANNLAWMLAERGENLDKALELAQTAKAVMPDSPYVTDTLGWVYYKKGMTTLAIQALREAASQSPTNPRIQYRLGVAYLSSGDRNNARASLEKSLKLDPKFDSADEARRLLGTIKG